MHQSLGETDALQHPLRILAKPQMVRALIEPDLREQFRNSAPPSEAFMPESAP